MSTYFNLFLLLLGTALVTSTPFYFNEEPKSNFNEEYKSEEAQNEQPAKPKIYRLTEDVIPASYELRIIPDLEKFTFSGSVEIEVLVKFSTNQIQLHSRKLNIKTITLNDGLQTLTKVTHKLDEANDLLIIESASELQFDKKYVLKIEFDGVLKDDMTGFYKSSYWFSNKEKWLASTQFEATHAREAFPCFDEPRFRTPFTIYIAHYNTQKAVSNMPVLAVSGPQLNLNYRVWTQFMKTPPMSTYLVSFMVSDFAYITDSERKVSVWTRENAIQQASYALKQSTKLLKHLEGYTGIAYKLPKLDVVALPDFDAGAMENWGMTTYRESCAILDELKSSEVHKARVTQVICHEFSHMWFGDLVTPAWWDFTWLNEAFARYFEYFAADKVEPSWELEKRFVVEQVQTALLSEIYTQRAMTTSVKTKSEIDNTFDVISYNKGASVLRMFEHILPPGTFRTALYNYLKTGSEIYGGTVVPQLLYEAFDKQAYRDSPSFPRNVLASDILKTWTENIGYPLITLRRNPETGKIIIKQTTYKSARAPKPLPDQEWIVPITYATKSNPDFSNTSPSLWSFANKDLELPEDVPVTDWVVLNKQQKGYYRVNYDYKSWQVIISQLRDQPEKIHVLNRAQLIDDVFALSFDEINCYHRPFQLVRYLTKETDIIPLRSAVPHLLRLFAEFEGQGCYDSLRDFIRDILITPYEHFGFEIKPTDSHVVKVAKPIFLTLACKLNVGDCQLKALQEYSTNQNALSNIQPDLKPVVYCIALSNSKDVQSTFDNIWNEYLKTNIAFDKVTILQSLSCILDVQTIKKVLSKLVDSKNKEIREQDKWYVYNAFSSGNGVYASIEFVTEKLPSITELDDYGLSALERILNGIKRNVKLAGSLIKLEDLEKKFSKLDQKKYGHLTKIVIDAYTGGRKKIPKREKTSQELAEIIQELLHPDAVKTTQSPTNAPSPSSATSMLISSLWSRLTIVVVVLCYGLPVLRVF